MKIQFSMSTLLLGIAFVAISFGGVTAVQTIQTLVPFMHVIRWQPYCAPFWIPLIFLAFALGEKRATIQWIAGFALSEAAAIGWLYWVSRPSIFA